MKLNCSIWEIKRKLNPDYLHGPVKQFTQEEIDEWYAASSEALTKVENTVKLSESDARFLDNMEALNAEERFKDLLEGIAEVDRENT